MPANAEGWEELEIAARVGEVSLQSRGLDLGKPQLHDDGSEDSMYDIEFPSADPPVALEITSITDPTYFVTAGTAKKLADRASSIADSQHTGSWLVEIDRNTRLGGDTEAWSLETVGGEAGDRFNELPDGIIRIHHDPEGSDEVRIGTWSSAIPTSLRPIHPNELATRIERKRKTLARVGSHERHLAIRLWTLRSRDLPPPPDLPEEIDLLWLLWWESDLTFWTERGSGEWNSNRNPWA